MQITGVHLNEFVTVVEEVSRLVYDHNVRVKDFTDLGGKQRPRIRVSLKAGNSHMPGARRSWSGRRMPVACWHVFRDVFNVCFESHPDAVIRTGMAVYNGRAGFLDAYPQTGKVNIGSQIQPAFMPELCECTSLNEDAFSLPPVYVMTENPFS